MQVRVIFPGQVRSLMKEDKEMKKRLTKLFALALAGCMAFGLAACGGSGSGSSGGEKDSVLVQQL